MPTGLITLTPIEGLIGSYGPPGGKIKIMDPSVGYAPEVHVTINGLQQIGASDPPSCYSLQFFASPDEFGPIVWGPSLFNMDWDTHASFWLGGGIANVLAPESVITAIVALEVDDGRMFDPNLDQSAIRFRGTLSS